MARVSDFARYYCEAKFEKFERGRELGFVQIRQIAREGFEPPTSGFPMRFACRNENPTDSLMGPASTPGCSTSLYFLKTLCNL